MSHAGIEFDVVFAGGGAAAGVAAGRLAHADPSLKILILEAGGHTKDNLFHTQPARYLTHLAPTSTTVKFYVGKNSEHLGGRAAIVPAGACLGGGSSVNFAMYTRASASDYDDWEVVYQNPGWGYKDLLPLLQKTETYQVGPNKPTHGYQGPLKVSYGGAFTNIGKEFLDVASKYDKERGSIDDPNCLTEVNKYGRWQKWISADTGKRSDVPHHFLYNQSNNKNLVLETGCVVKRVIFEGKRAVGVEYLYNPTRRPNEDSQTVHTVRAKRLVVVTAGALGSPQILERSGIGASHILSKIGVEQVVDLPGVGENYQDHQVIFAPYVASDDAETLDGIVRSDEQEVQRWHAVWEKDGSGLMAHNALDAGGKMRPTPEELEAIGPSFKQRWESYFQGRGQDKPVYFLCQVSVLVGDPSTAPVRKYFAVGYMVEYPSSAGHVHCTTASDVHALPDFDPGYLSKPDDLAILKFGYKRAREFARRMPSYRGEYVPLHPTFPQGSEATAGEDKTPVPVDAANIKYTAEDEEAIERYTQAAVGTAWHSLGTCAMKPREQGGVVDSQLNVYGTEGLKVADISIAPGNVGANTYSTALVIGEKSAIIIGEYLGVKGV